MDYVLLDASFPDTILPRIYHFDPTQLYDRRNERHGLFDGQPDHRSGCRINRWKQYRLLLGELVADQTLWQSAIEYGLVIYIDLLSCSCNKRPVLQFRPTGRICVQYRGMAGALGSISEL